MFQDFTADLSLIHFIFFCRATTEKGSLCNALEGMPKHSQLFHLDLLKIRNHCNCLQAWLRLQWSLLWKVTDCNSSVMNITRRLFWPIRESWSCVISLTICYRINGIHEEILNWFISGTLEPTYRQLQTMKLDKSPFVIISVIGQELLAQAKYNAAVQVLESALKIGTCSLKLRGSVFSALSSAYWALNSLDKVSY